MTNAELLHLLRERETALHRSDLRHNPLKVKSLLHNDFLEFGRSGVPYDKAAILAELGNETSICIWAQDFELKRLSACVALLTYRSARVSDSGVLERHTLRSSIWKYEMCQWQIIFHQGTPTQTFEPRQA